jgi:N-acetylglutamate synthase-like GNAT family acetyltransferase
MSMSGPRIDTDVRVVPFVQSDQTEVLEVILPIQREEFGIPINAEDQPDLQAVADFYQTGAGGFWVAKANGRVVGTIGLKDIGNKAAALRKMFVATAYRGSPSGTAKKLLTTLLTEAEKRGITTIFLGTTDKFIGAHRFYEKNGFSEIDRHQLPATFPVMAVDTKFYMINLTRESPDQVRG